MNGIYEHSTDNAYEGNLNPGQVYTGENKDLELGIFSIAMELNSTERSSHQFEIMPFRFHRQDVNETITEGDNIQIVGEGLTTTFQSVLWYQYIYYFRPDKIIRPYLGPALQLFCKMSSYRPYVSLTYPAGEFDFGLLLAAAPGMDIKLGDKLRLDINLPLGFYDFKLNSVRTDNPTVTLNQRRTSKLTGAIPPGKLNFRVGLCYAL